MIHVATPGLPLSGFVDQFWLLEGVRLPHDRERVLPDGTIELIFDLGPDAPAAPLVSGARSTSFVIGTGRPLSIMGVSFAVGGAFPFLDVPAGEIQDMLVPLGTLWGPWADRLQGELIEAPTPGRKCCILERGLLARATRPLARHPAVSAALAEFARAHLAKPVGDVARRVGLSPKQLLRVFRDEVGLTPKLFSRVRRFQATLSAVDGRRAAWAAIAHDCGYADQAHLIRDFRAFSGLSPTAYLASRGKNRNHIPLRA
jgi:AraC-like DNA-binding protein